jgi:hypothetical protein
MRQVAMLDGDLAVNGEPATGVSAPLLGSMVYAEMLEESRLAT